MKNKKRKLRKVETEKKGLPTYREIASLYFQRTVLPRKRLAALSHL